MTWTFEGEGGVLIMRIFKNLKVYTKRKGVKSTQKSDHLVYKNTVPGFVKLSVYMQK